MKLSIKKNIGYLLVFFASFLFSFFILNHHSPGVTTDSVLFIDTAINLYKYGLYQSILNENSVSVHHPPLYVYLISFLSNFSTPLQAVKFINSITFAIFAVFVYKILDFHIKEQKFAVISFIICVFMELVLYPFVMSWTEPVFISLIFPVLVSLNSYVSRGKIVYFLIAIFFSATALLTRYAAFPLVLWGACFIFLFYRAGLTRRIFQSVLYFLLSILPALFWLLHVLQGQLTFSKVRNFHFHPIAIRHLRHFIRTILFIFLPNSFLNYLKESIALQIVIAASLFFIGLVSVYCLIKNQKKWKLNYQSFSSLSYSSSMGYLSLAGFSIAYFSFLLISISFFDYNTPLDYRICAPGLIPLFMSILIFLFRNTKEKKLLIILVSLFMVLVLIRALAFSYETVKEGFGYTSKSWQKSEIIKYILKSDYEVYSNCTEGIYFLTE